MDAQEDPSVKFTVRFAHHTDAAAISELIRGLGMFGRLEAEDASLTAVHVADHLARCLSDESHSVFVAELPGGQLVGYASVHWLPYLFLAGPEGYVSELFVTEPHRGAGVGSELLDTTVDAARSRGCSRLMLAAVRSRESYERGFYQKRGWFERADVANMVYEL